MIQEYVDAIRNNQEDIKASFTNHPSYDDLVKKVISYLPKRNGYKMDPSKIHAIDDGDYQGTYLWIVPVDTYQPYTYYVFKCGYGSCSGCDTLEAIRGKGNYETLNDKQRADYYLLCLNLAESIREI